MRIIPVLDLLNGRVVRAKGGQRAAYRPWISRLSPDAEPATVLRSLLDLHALTTVYVADLNAIQRRGDNRSSIDLLLREFPAVEFWLDAGAATVTSPASRPRAVLGTESGVTPEALRVLEGRRDEVVLSLDFNADGPIGDARLFADSTAWPDDVIVMHLPAIGMASGPALELARTLPSRRPRCRMHLAGGFRDLADLKRARAAGIDGALVATMLHDNDLAAADVAELETAAPC
jgi:phosphoribosylformimino-5-aminoimidazole carboxamide ribotide isomerase